MTETILLKENTITSKKSHDTRFESIAVKYVFILKGLLSATVLVWIA